MGFLEGTTLAIPIRENFPCVVLDFDKVEFLYQEENITLLKFLCFLKNTTGFILSSPVYNCGYRF